MFNTSGVFCNIYGLDSFFSLGACFDTTWFTTSGPLAVCSVTTSPSSMNSKLIGRRSLGEIKSYGHPVSHSLRRVTTLWPGGQSGTGGYHGPFALHAAAAAGTTSTAGDPGGAFGFGLAFALPLAFAFWFGFGGGIIGVLVTALVAILATPFEEKLACLLRFCLVALIANRW